MPDKKDDQRPDEDSEAAEGKSILSEGQTSFVDEESSSGKQLTGGGRKVADLEHVGASSPDADPERDSEAPRKSRDERR